MNFQVIFASLGLTLSFLSHVYSQERQLPDILWNSNSMEIVRQRVKVGDGDLRDSINQLISEADRSMAGSLVSVTHKSADLFSPSGNPHDFVSVSTYHWPNESDPKAPWVWKDGNFNRAMIEKYDSPRLKSMTVRVIDGTLAWWFTGKDEYAKMAVDQLRCWFIDDETKMTPHLEYAQFIPNSHDSRGKSFGIIDTRNFVPMLSAVKLLYQGGKINDKDVELLRDWFRSYVNWLVTSDLGIEESNRSNNHGVFYDLQVSAYAMFVGNDDLVNKILGDYPDRRLVAQIGVDGAMQRELKRADAGTYSVFNLLGMSQMICLSQSAGVDLLVWTSQDGRSMKGAVRWFVPFVDGGDWGYTGSFSSNKFAENLRMIASSSADQEMIQLSERIPPDQKSRIHLLYPLPPK